MAIASQYGHLWRSCMVSHIASGFPHPVTMYGTPFVAKLFSAIGDSYFKPTRFFIELTWFLHNQIGFSTELTRFLFRTNSIALLNWLGFFSEPIHFFSEPTRLFYRTDSIILQNKLNYFTELTWFFTEQSWFFELIFCISKQDACPQPASYSFQRKVM